MHKLWWQWWRKKMMLWNTFRARGQSVYSLTHGARCNMCVVHFSRRDYIGYGKKKTLYTSLDFLLEKWCKRRDEAIVAANAEIILFYIFELQSFEARVFRLCTRFSVSRRGKRTILSSNFWMKIVVGTWYVQVKCIQYSFTKKGFQFTMLFLQVWGILSK